MATTRRRIAGRSRWQRHAATLASRPTTTPTPDPCECALDHDHEPHGCTRPGVERVEHYNLCPSCRTHAGI